MTATILCLLGCAAWCVALAAVIRRQRNRWAKCLGCGWWFNGLGEAVPSAVEDSFGGVVRPGLCPDCLGRRSADAVARKTEELFKKGVDYSRN